MTKVVLAGTGPGNADLITVRAQKALSQADCVVYDESVPSEILNLAPACASRIVSSAGVVATLLERATAGSRVVRLFHGDPYTSQPGWLEALSLSMAGLSFEIIPGITEALGAAAYAGVPLAGGTVWVTAWTQAQLHDQLDGLMADGYAPTTPAIAVRRPTHPDQLVTAGTIASLTVAEFPVTVLAGEAVILRGMLSWFEQLPLFGQTVVVTRAREQAGVLAARLRDLGAKVIELPTIEILPASDYGPLDTAIHNLPEYDWLIFTSANGVRHFLERLDASRVDLRAIRAKICAIGPATRDAIEQFHIKVDVLAEEYVAEGLLRSLAAFDLKGTKILIARAAVARDILPTELHARGAHVDVVEAYRTVAPARLRERAAAVLAAKPDWVAFTSSSTAQNLIDACGAEALAHVHTASIGPVTSATLRKNNVPVTLEAKQYTVPGLVDAILATRIMKT